MRQGPCLVDGGPWVRDIRLPGRVPVHGGQGRHALYMLQSCPSGGWVRDGLAGRDGLDDRHDHTPELLFLSKAGEQDDLSP